VVAAGWKRRENTRPPGRTSSPAPPGAVYCHACGHALDGSMERRPCWRTGNDALKKMGQVVRRWKLHRRTDLTCTELARMINPVVRGRMRYSADHISRPHQHLPGAVDSQEIQTVPRPQRGIPSLGPRDCERPWALCPLPTGLTSAAVEDDGSRVTGDCRARF
jgi:hypothetical protein